MSGTNVAQNHQRGRTPAPALGFIGTHSAAANGMQRMFFDDSRYVGKRVVSVEPDFEPGGFFRSRYLVIGIRHFRFIIFQLIQK